MIRRPPRSTLDRSSAASDVYKRQVHEQGDAHAIGTDAGGHQFGESEPHADPRPDSEERHENEKTGGNLPVSYTHLRAHETPEHLVCRLLLEKKKKNSLR